MCTIGNEYSVQQHPDGGGLQYKDNSGVLRNAGYKHPTKLGDPGILSNQHLQVKTLKSVQKQNDALLKANQGLNQDFADNINAFFAADVKTASEV